MRQFARTDLPFGQSHCLWLYPNGTGLHGAGTFGGGRGGPCGKGEQRRAGSECGGAEAAAVGREADFGMAKTRGQPGCVKKLKNIWQKTGAEAKDRLGD